MNRCSSSWPRSVVPAKQVARLGWWLVLASAVAQAILMGPVREARATV